MIERRGEAGREEGGSLSFGAMEKRESEHQESLQYARQYGTRFVWTLLAAL